MTRYFTRRLLVLVAAAVAFPAAACSTDGTPTAVDDPTTSTSTTTPTTTELTPKQKDRIFLQVIAKHGLHGQSAIDAAKATCDALDAGVPAETVALTALEALGDVEKAGALLGAGVEAYCPEHSADFADLGKGSKA